MKVEDSWSLGSRWTAGYIVRPLSVAATSISFVQPYGNSTASAAIGYSLTDNANLKLERAWNGLGDEEIDSLFYNLRW
jgi:hypothetical protein